MIRIEAAKEGDVFSVASRLRERDSRELMATSFADTKAELVEDLVQRFGEPGGTICAYDGDVPTAIGATIERRPNVLTLLFFATDDFDNIAIGLTSFITKRLFPAQRAAGVHRIECVSIFDHTDAHRWIEILGLSKEAEMPCFGKDGETFYQFAWTETRVSSDLQQMNRTRPCAIPC